MYLKLIMRGNNTVVRGAVSDLMILSALHMVMVPLSEPPMISPLGWVPYALHTNLWNQNAHVWMGMEESMVEQCKLLVSQIGALQLALY